MELGGGAWEAWGGGDGGGGIFTYRTEAMRGRMVVKAKGSE